MLVRYRILTLFVVVLLMAACTASQAAPAGFSFYWWYDSTCPCWVLTIDFHWTTTSSLAVKGFQFDLQSDPTKATFESLEVLSPFVKSPTNPDLGGGLFRVSGAAPEGTLPPAGEVNLATISFFDIFPELNNPVHPTIPLFTVSTGPNGYALLSDGTSLGPGDIQSVSSVPEPSSIAALLAGMAGLAGFGLRRKTS